MSTTEDKGLRVLGQAEAPTPNRQAHFIAGFVSAVMLVEAGFKHADLVRLWKTMKGEPDARGRG